MLVCQHNADLYPSTESDQEVDWTHPAQAYTNLEEMPSFISRQQQSAAQRAFTTSADPQRLQGKQLQAYSIVWQHMEAEAPPPLRMIVSGTAGTRTWKESVCTICSSPWQECIISSSMKCPWSEERSLVRLTSVFAKCSLTMLISCLEAAPACYLETLANYLQ